MSWTRQNFLFDSYFPLNYTSGYWAKDKTEEDFGLFEEDIAGNPPTATKTGYVIPTLKYWKDNAGLAGSIAPQYQRIRTVYMVIDYPNINQEYGYFCSAATENPYKAMFKIGFQQRISNFDANDNWVSNVTSLSDFDGDVRINFGGMPDKMQEAIEFYQNGYSDTKFTTILHVNYMIGTRTGTEEDDYFIQVPWLSYLSPLHQEANLLYDSSYNIIDTDTCLPPVTDDSTKIKALPSYAYQSNSDFVGDTADGYSVPGVFKLWYYYYPSTYPSFIQDLRNRYKYEDQIVAQNTVYVEEKVSIITDLLSTLLVMPKEFRVRMQTSKPYNLSGISSISDGTTTTAPTISPGPSTGGSMGGGSMGGSTGGSGY